MSGKRKYTKEFLISELERFEMENGRQPKQKDMPCFLHQLHSHNHNKEETMTTPNALAFDYWVNEELYQSLYLTGELE